MASLSTISSPASPSLAVRFGASPPQIVALAVIAVFLLAFLVLFPKSKTTEKLVQKVGQKMPRVERFLRKMGIGTVPQQDTMPVE